MPKRMVFSTWVDHMAFGYDIVAAVQPKLLVELGTHNGLSYFTFCQSVLEHTLDTVCYAVDTWEGDKHTDAYDESIFTDVERHNRIHYWGFSYLLRMRFNEALSHFDDNSIDLLHIDGLHTYDAVKNDFETWLPKVRPGGVILFHDVMAKREDFGVWKFWHELQQQHNTFHFNHGFGLGVLFKPGDPCNDSDEAPLIQLLKNTAIKNTTDLRNLYTNTNRYIELKRMIKADQFGNPNRS